MHHNYTELTLPDAIRWAQLHGYTKEYGVGDYVVGWHTQNRGFHDKPWVIGELSYMGNDQYAHPEGKLDWCTLTYKLRHATPEEIAAAFPETQTDPDPRELEFPLEMEVSDDGEYWETVIVDGYLLGHENCQPWRDEDGEYWQHTRLPVTRKSFSEELAERGVELFDKDTQWNAAELIQSLRVNSYLKEFGEFLQRLENKGIIEPIKWKK